MIEVLFFCSIFQILDPITTVMGIRKQPEIAVMLAGVAFWLFSLYFLYCTIIFRYFGAVGAIMWVQHTARPMQHKPQTQTLSIRLPQELADRLGEVATRYEMTRTAVLIEILTGAIDTWQPATHSATRPQHDTLSGAIETIRIELDETIDRVARLERATRPATQTAKPRDPDKPGRSLGQIAFDLKLTQKPTDRNYDLRCQHDNGMKLRDYLIREGWTQSDRRWFPPDQG